jgi:hypothetical protein
MLKGRYVLVFRDARFLPCRPGEPPPGVIAERQQLRLQMRKSLIFTPVRGPAFHLPAIMLQPSISLDFRRQRHHVELSALTRMLTFWPRDERSPFSFLACNQISFDCPGHVGRRAKIPLLPRRISRSRPGSRKTNN